MRVPPTALPVLLLVTALVAGCSGGGDSSEAQTAASSGGGGADEAAADGYREAAGADREAAGVLQVTDLRVAPGAAVIRTADLEVRVEDVRAAADAAGRAVRTAGGRVEAEDRTGTGSDGSASLSLRVPPADFDRLLADLAALGEEQSRRVGSEDVTDPVVDLEARLATQRASVTRVRALLADADALGEVVQIESELTKRTADLEALQARLESLTTRVDLSTVTLRLESRDAAFAGSALGFGDGLRGGWSALTTVGRLLAVTAGALLPFLPLLLLAGLLGWRLHVRRTQVVRA